MKHIKLQNQQTEQRIDELKKIYNLATDTKLIKHIVDLDYGKHKNLWE